MDTLPWYHDGARYRYVSKHFGLMESDCIPEEDGVFTKGTIWFCGKVDNQELRGQSQVR